jgi:predicted transcriptional regulator
MSNRSAAGSARRLELRIGRGGDALDRFEAGWNRLTEGQKLAELRVLTLEDLPRLLAALTPARWALLGRLRKDGPLTIYQLAKRLARDYKNVHTDVSRLIELGLIERSADARVSVPWDVVRAEF